LKKIFNFSQAKRGVRTHNDDYPDYTELKLSDAFMDIEGLKLTGIDKIPLEKLESGFNWKKGGFK